MARLGVDSVRASPKLEMSAVVSIYQKGSNCGDGRSRLSDARGDWPMWFDPTDELKVLKKLMLVLIEM